MIVSVTDENPPEVMAEVVPIKTVEGKEYYLLDFQTIDSCDPNPIQMAIVEVPLPKDLSD